MPRNPSRGISMHGTTDTWQQDRFDPQFVRQKAEEFRQFMREARQQARPHGRHRGGFGPGPGGPRGFPFGGPWFGGGRRAGRGDIRAAILALLAEQPMHGYQIIQELERRSDGAWRPSPGSVYPTLQQLEDEGLVKAVEQETGRRVFELTDAGQTEAKAATGPAPWDEAAGSVDDDLHSLRDLFAQTAAATWQVARHGTPKQIASAQEVLRDTRKRMYQLLAEDPADQS